MQPNRKDNMSMIGASERIPRKVLQKELTNEKSYSKTVMKSIPRTV